MITIWIIVFIVALAALVISSDYFVDSSEEIGLGFGISPFVIGMTLVAVGTSLPELATSIASVIKGTSEIVIGNVVGSNVANIFLVLAMSAIVGKRLLVNNNVLQNDLPFFIGSGLILAIMVWDLEFGLFDGVICLLGLAFYIIYLVKNDQIDVAEKQEKSKISAKAIAIFIITFIAIPTAAYFTIDAVEKIGNYFGIANEVFGLTVIALGTSLPELFVCIAAVKKEKYDIAIGNVLGSNVFNAFAVMGIPALAGDLIIPTSIKTFALPLMVVGAFMFFFIIQDRKISKWEGMLLLLFYIFYIGQIIRTNM